MKKVIGAKIAKIISFGVMFCLLPASIYDFVEAGPSGKGSAAVRIVNSAQVVDSEELEFGAISPGKSDGTVILTPPSTRTTTGGVVAVGGFQPAEFEIRGEPLFNYNVSIPDQQVFNDNGPGALNVTDFQVLSKSLGVITPNGQMDNDGKDELKVGGTLIVPSGTPPGEYEGEIVIDVSY